MSLQRRTPLARGNGLEPGKGPVRRTPLKVVSAARAAENRLRRAMVKQLWPDRPLCVVYDLHQVNPELIPDVVISGCGRWADDVHEPLTRARGGSITDRENALPPCRPCHNVLTFTPESELGWAYATGLLRHSWGAA